MIVIYSLGTRPSRSSVTQSEINGASIFIYLKKCVIQCLVICFVELCPFLNVVCGKITAENYIDY